MKRATLLAVIPLLTLALAACSDLEGTSNRVRTPTSPPTSTPAPPTPTRHEPITLPISVYILDDEDQILSSARTVEELKRIYDEVNGIWAQAGVALEVRTIQRITVAHEVLREVVGGDFGPFFRAADRDFDLREPSLLNGFYARDIGGPNGITPFGTRIFFVKDTPTVHDERVTAHEIGHILGLHHTLRDRSRLLYPGTNGMGLTEEEMTVARYVAQGLLNGQR